MSLKLAELPVPTDIPRALRILADDIESGEKTDATLFAYVIAYPDDDIQAGIIGNTANSDSVAHLLYAKAMRYIEGCY